MRAALIAHNYSRVKRNYGQHKPGCIQNYRREVDACSSALRDIVALLIFIKRSSPSAVFHSESFRQPAHNENKISCLNFTRIITKRRAVTPRKNTAAYYDRQLRANVTGEKAEGISAQTALVFASFFFLFVPFFPLSLSLFSFFIKRET